jgi:hypothetical protein
MLQRSEQVECEDMDWSDPTRVASSGDIFAAQNLTFDNASQELFSI